MSIPPFFVMTFETEEGLVTATYKLTKEEYLKPEPSEATTPRGLLQMHVLNELGFMIPKSGAAANKAHYTPLDNLLKQLWFKYHVKSKGKADNEGFAKRYADRTSEFHKTHKYGDLARDALTALLQDAKAYMQENELTYRDVRSLESVAMNLSDRKDYILAEEERQVVLKAVHTNGN